VSRDATGNLDRSGLAQEQHELETADGTSTSSTRKEGARVETIINEYISRELVQDPALLPLANETSLLESGILDSLSLLRPVVFLEERFGMKMGDADLLPGNFASVNTICAYLPAHQPAKQKAAHG
jgi:acyl carrier protein